MTRLPFSKWEAVGNDFVVLDDSDVASCRDLARLSSRICDRHRGVGADGLLVYGVETSQRLSFRIFNADGSEDTMCGNGLRCVVSDAHSRGRIATTGIASTRAGAVGWNIGTAGQVSLTLPPPSFETHRIPTTAPRTDHLSIVGYDIDIVQTGSPHAVVFVAELPEDPTFIDISPRIETHPWFPEHVSVMWATVRSECRLQLRIWERGVGETRGCGTGACAAAVAAMVRGLVGDTQIEVESVGGRLHVGWTGPGESMRLAGGARCVFRGDISPSVDDSE